MAKNSIRPVTAVPVFAPKGKSVLSKSKAVKRTIRKADSVPAEAPEVAPDAGAAVGLVPKLAERIAMKIEGDIVRSGWKIGTLLGSEAELVERYGVSRWVIREAIGIIERDGLVTNRRGRNGGLVVTAPALETVGSAIRQYFGASRVTLSDVIKTWEVLESLVISLVTRRLDDAKITQLRAACKQALHADAGGSTEAALLLMRTLYQSAGNPALEVFCFALAQQSLDLAVRHNLSESALKEGATILIGQRAQQIEAIIACDIGRAELLVREQLSTTERLLQPIPEDQRSSSIQQLSYVGRRLYATADKSSRVNARPRLTELVARELEADLALRDLPVGTQLGSEAELMLRFNVSRTVLREAIRPLERMGVVEMRRGRGCGLTVSKPDPSAIIRSVALYLRFAKLDEMACEDIERTLEMAIVAGLTGLPLQRRHEIAEQLQLVAQSSPTETWGTLARQARGFGLTLVGAEPNPVLGFFLRALIEILRFRKEQPFPSANLQAVARALQSQVMLVAQAVADGDEAVARRRMIDLWQAGRSVAFSHPGGGDRAEATKAASPA